MIREPATILCPAERRFAASRMSLCLGKQPAGAVIPPAHAATISPHHLLSCMCAYSTHFVNISESLEHRAGSGRIDAPPTEVTRLSPSPSITSFDPRGCLHSTIKNFDSGLAGSALPAMSRRRAVFAGDPMIPRSEKTIWDASLPLASPEAP